MYFETSDNFKSQKEMGPLDSKLSWLVKFNSEELNVGIYLCSKLK